MHLNKNETIIIKTDCLAICGIIDMESILKANLALHYFKISYGHHLND